MSVDLDTVQHFYLNFAAFENFIRDVECALAIMLLFRNVADF